MRSLTSLTSLTAAGILAAMCGGCATPKPGVAVPPLPSVPVAQPVQKCPDCRYVGVSAVPVSKVQAFTRTVGIHFNIIEEYRTFGTPFKDAEFPQIVAQRALPLIQMNPYNVSLASIVAGRFNSYLRTYATELRRLHRPVAISFAPEANGDWYSWGCHHTSAAVYRMAWRHIWRIFARAGDKTVIWIWDVNAVYKTACRLSARWPGQDFVTWVGVDGYLRYAKASFNSEFRRTVDEVRKITDKPILITETGVRPSSEAPAQIDSLFSGVRNTPGFIGLVYFEYASRHGDYRLEDDPAGLRAFREAASAFLR